MTSPHLRPAGWAEDDMTASALRARLCHTPRRLPAGMVDGAGIGACPCGYGVPVLLEGPCFLCAPGRVPVADLRNASQPGRGKISLPPHQSGQGAGQSPGEEQ